MSIVATPPSDDTRTLFKLLRDRQWHPYVEIRDELARTVPPGRALRKYEERYKQNRKDRRTAVTDPPYSEDDQIKFGQRACAQIVITSWKGRGIQHRVVDEQKQIRVDPNFKSWHQMIPGYVPGSDEEPEGYTEVPPGVSEASTVPGAMAQEASVGEPVPSSAPGPAEQTAVAPPVEGPSPPQPSPSVIRPVGPSCEECGLVISDQARHDAWHKHRRADLERPEMALFDEQAMRTLLGDVMGQELAAFQKGMQGWLMQQFAQLAMLIGASAPAPSWLAGDPQRGVHRSQ